MGFYTGNIKFAENDNLISKSLQVESKFILSPILSFRENQDKINAIIERSEQEDIDAFQITEVDL